MKKQCIKPNSNIKKFKVVDVVTTSLGGDEPIVTLPNWED